MPPCLFKPVLKTFKWSAPLCTCYAQIQMCRRLQRTSRIRASGGLKGPFERIRMNCLHPTVKGYQQEASTSPDSLTFLNIQSSSKPQLCCSSCTSADLKVQAYECAGWAPLQTTVWDKLPETRIGLNEGQFCKIVTQFGAKHFFLRKLTKDNR